jgi:site-specific DNA recombinase
MDSFANKDQRRPFARLAPSDPLDRMLKPRFARVTAYCSSVPRSHGIEHKSFPLPGRSRHPKKSAGSCSRANASRSDGRPERFKRRARLVSVIARGPRWLDDVVSGRKTTVAELCAREKCSVRQVNMTISLVFLAPNLVKAAVGRSLPRGISVKRLRDPPTEWSRQFVALGLNVE